MRSSVGALALILLASDAGAAEPRRVASPQGVASVEVGGRWDQREGYVGGRWIDIHAGRPIRRGRDLFGPPDWKEALEDGAEIWRAGANFSTRLVTETALRVEGVLVEPGEYTMFIDLGDDRWTLAISAWPAQQGTYDFENEEALFGAYDYTADRDVVRAPMRLEELPWSVEQLTWQFLDTTDSGGRIAIAWGRKMASVAFEIEND